MTVFACVGCHATLTVPVRQVALPAHAHGTFGHGLLGPLMEPGTYAVDPEPSGPPWKRWADVGTAEAAARGVYAPVYALSFGPRNAVVVAPGDVRGTEFIPDRLDGSCCGLDERHGPNLACAQCGVPVATRIDDCGRPQEMWLDPRAVYGVAASQPEITGWLDLLESRAGVPPVEPDGWWHPLWQAAIGEALARVVVASGGAQVTVPDGRVADFFRPGLDALLSPAAQAKDLALAGPGLPACNAHIALVPRHPQTGETWAQHEAADAVPLAWDVWAFLALHQERRPVPGGGVVSHIAFREDPPPPYPPMSFPMDDSAFSATLVRLPQVREPWLRRIYDAVSVGGPVRGNP